MKSNIHPQYYTNAKVTCVCGNTWETGSTLKEIRVEICSKCHPFYTGKQKLVDSARRVEKFEERLAKKAAMAKMRRGKKVKRVTRDSKRKSISEKKLEIKKVETSGMKNSVNKVNKIVNGSAKLTAGKVDNKKSKDKQDKK